MPIHFPTPKLTKGTGFEDPPISLVDIEPVARECFRKFGENAIIRLMVKLRHVFAPEVILTTLMKIAGDNLVEMLIEIAEKV